MSRRRSLLALALFAVLAVGVGPVSSASATSPSAATITVATDGTWVVDGGTATASELDDGACTPHPYWSTALNSIAEWIWSTECPNGNDTTHTFSTTFSVPGLVVSADLSLAADNNGTAAINGQDAGVLAHFTTAATADVTSSVTSGQNVIEVTAWNDLVATCTPTKPNCNPAGVIAALTVEYLPVAQSKDECKKGGWQHTVRPDLTRFENQGDCVSFFASDGKSDARGR